MNTVSMQAQGITRLSSLCFLSASPCSVNLGRAIFGAASAGRAFDLRFRTVSAILCQSRDRQIQLVLTPHVETVMFT